MQTPGEQIGVSYVLVASPELNQPGGDAIVAYAKWVARRLTLC